MTLNSFQIISKLPMFTNGLLQILTREPVLQEKRAEHVMFQKHAHELIKMVSRGEGKFPFICSWARNNCSFKSGSSGHLEELGSDYSMAMLNRAAVVAQTKITFPKKQLLQLIQVRTLFYYS